MLMAYDTFVKQMIYNQLFFFFLREDFITNSRLVWICQHILFESCISTWKTYIHCSVFLLLDIMDIQEPKEKGLCWFLLAINFFYRW
uniref:Uncharacterized protein n=1 Tax=Rhizophora mucronata TaxID=61149 RepID=A0A2P2J457_RHIMU